MSKKQKDISTYFVSNKRSRSDVDKNNSEPSTTHNFYDKENNNEPGIVSNDEVPAVVSSLSLNQNSNITINIPVNDDDIGLYVLNNTAKNDFSLLNRLLIKPWIPSSNYVFPKIEQNGKNRSVCQHSWLVKYSWLTYSKLHQGVYCRYCVLFSRQGENQSLGQFINKP